MHVKRRIVAAAAVTLTAVVVLPSIDAVHAAPPVATTFGMSASGYASEMLGGGIPAGSGRTAFSHVSCTNLAPVAHTGSLSSVTYADLVTVDGATTINRTFKRGKQVAAVSRTEVADVSIGLDPDNALHLQGLFTEVRAWHAADGFGRNSKLSLGNITLVLGGVELPEALIPDLGAGETIEIPGVARIGAGPEVGSITSNSARNKRTLLDIELLGLGEDPTRVQIGVAHAKIVSGFTGGPITGVSSAVKGTIADGLVTLGPVAPRPQACKGTGGQWRSSNAADFNLAPVATGTGAGSRVWGLQGDHTATARGQSGVSSIQFTAIPLRIDGVGTAVYVRKNPNGTYVRNVVFDTVTITFDGEELTSPDPGVPLEIPGVGSISLHQRRTRATGVLATAVHIVLLDDTVIDLGQVSAYIG